MKNEIWKQIFLLLSREKVFFQLFWNQSALNNRVDLGISHNMLIHPIEEEIIGNNGIKDSGSFDGPFNYGEINKILIPIEIPTTTQFFTLYGLQNNNLEKLQNELNKISCTNFLVEQNQIVITN